MNAKTRHLALSALLGEQAKSSQCFAACQLLRTGDARVFLTLAGRYSNDRCFQRLIGCAVVLDFLNRIRQPQGACPIQSSSMADWMYFFSDMFKLSFMKIEFFIYLMELKFSLAI